jgi:hypothetical protein
LSSILSRPGALCTRERPSGPPASLLPLPPQEPRLQGRPSLRMCLRSICPDHTPGYRR